jgi:hypothetical protein
MKTFNICASLLFTTTMAATCITGTTEVTTFNNNSLVCIGYDQTAATAEQVIFYAHVLENTYAAIGFSTASMINTDMIGFYAGADTSTSRCQGLYADLKMQPDEDASSSLTAGTIAVDSDESTFINMQCTRALAPSEADEYEIVLDSSTALIAAYGGYTSPTTIVYHTGRYSGLAVTFTADGVTNDAADDDDTTVVDESTA